MATHWLVVCIYLLQLTSVLGTRIVANTTDEYLNSRISCDEEATCFIKCAGYRSCMGSIFECNNSSQCLIHCEGLESCSFSTIYQSSSNNIEISCQHKRSCLFMNVYQQTDNIQITNNSTFTVHATAPYSAQHLNLHDTISHTVYNLYCNESSSCNALAIHFNPNVSTISTLDNNLYYNMNIMCDGIESCKDIKVETTDNWYNIINDHGIVYNTFNVSLYCVDILSCEDATFDFSKLLSNGFADERNASDFGDIHLYCGGPDSISACDNLKLTCPDLVPFDAYYDYLYQQENIKCHVSMQSYSELVTVVSKHGFNMVDLECDSSDNEICDEVVLFCSEVDIKCTMNYDADNAAWVCDDLGEFYTFPANEYAVYGCASFVWFSDTAVITTSEIPNYSIYTHSYLWCLTYNPAMTQKCITNCDIEYSCFETTLDCADSTECIVNCDAKEACGASFSSPLWTTIICPYNWGLNSSTDIAPARTCDITAHPELNPSSYGSFFTELWIKTFDNNVVSIDHDPTISWLVLDFGMTSLDVTIADYPEVANFSVYDDYFADNWYRIHDMHTSYDPVTFSISCTFCYNVWMIFNGYWDRFGSQSYIRCHENCMNSQIDIYGVTESYISCSYAQSNCNQTDITVVDGYLYTECYVNCDEMNVYNNPYYHYDYSVLYNVVVYSYEPYPPQDNINIYSLFGFDHLTVTYYYYPLLTPLNRVQGHCGYPNYFQDCGAYPYLNASCNFTQCSATHPKYQTIALATTPLQYFETTITSLFTICRAYEACWNANIQCGIAGRGVGDDECLVICHDRFACYNSTIYANEYKLTLNCVGYRSCENTKVYGTTTTEYIEINCLNALSCYNMAVDHSLATYIEDGDGLKVTCYDLNQVLDIVSYRSTSCVNLDIHCPSTPSAEQLVNTNYDVEATNIKEPKCHLIMENNIVENTNIVVRNDVNGVEFFDITCQYNNVTQISACSDVVFFCDADDTMSSRWYYDTSSEEHVCNGTCCHFINSEAPTSSPTSAPTRAPTVWRYEVFFDAMYDIRFSFDSTTDLRLFEEEFYNHSLSESLEGNEYFIDEMQDALQVAYFRSDATPSFADFHVNITNITSTDNDEERRRILAQHSNDTVSVGFDIYARISSVNSSTIDRFLAITRYSFDFDSNLIDYLVEQYPLISSINFSVISVDYEEPTDEEPEEAFSISSGTFLSIGVTGTLFIVALCGFLYTKKLFCFKNAPDCDDTTYLDVMSYGMQIFDLYTDITFSLELHSKYKEYQENNPNDPKYIFIEFLWVFSLVFIGLPYICNIIMAITFQSESRFGSNLRLNFYARTWFAQYNTLFCLFVMLCGSVFASLLLVNCKLFGLKIFHAGISMVEIESVDKLKIYYITLLENVPQLLIQIFYVVNFGEEAVTVTFVASTISSIFNITLTVMSFLARKTSQAKINVDSITILSIEIVSKDAEEERADGNGDIIPKQVKALHRRDGRRAELAKNVTVTLNRLAGNFEFLYSVQNVNGIQLFGICVSDTPASLKKQIAKFQKKLISVVKSTFSLENMDRWEVSFDVPTKDGSETPSRGEMAEEVESPEGASGGGTDKGHAVFSDSEHLDTKGQTDEEAVEMQPTATERELLAVLSEDDIDDIEAMLKDIND